MKFVYGNYEDKYKNETNVVDEEEVIKEIANDLWHIFDYVTILDDEGNDVTNIYIVNK